MILNSTRKSIYCILLASLSFAASAQCPPGYSKFTLKWDYLDNMVATGNYAFSTGYYTSLAYIQSQFYSFGNQRLNILCTYGKNNMIGENITHKGEAGSYGNGKPGPITSTTDPDIDADVQYLGNGQVTLTFDTEVSNLQFSIFDIDNKQVMDMTAADASATPLPIVITPLGIPGTPGIGTAGVSQLIITGNNTTAVNITSPLVGGLPQYANTSAVNASFNVDIAGPVKKVTFIVTNSGNDGFDNGSYWLSDITACTPGSFPNNYYAVSKPFTGQPSYVLHSLGNSVYKLDPATGKTTLLFTDPAVVGANASINSMAYDPYNKFLYYVFDDGLPNSPGRSLKRYDFNAESVSTVSTDLVALGIALSTYEGVNNGGAAFYNGSLFLGIQTTNATSNSGREALIWRIDFNAANVPYQVSQAFGMPCDDGAGLVDAFGDFVIRDGTLFKSDNAGDEPNYYTVDMNTGLGTIYTINPFPDDQPGELALDWTGKIYQLLADNLDGIPAYVAPYNEDGTIGAKTNIFSSPMFTPAIPILADATGPFRPKSDFGDAPASYDPAGVDPATHERDLNLQLGTGWGQEFVKTGVVDGDTFDDGLGAAPPLNYFGTTTYSINVNVLNNTGANATLVCWLDWNFNGVYDPGEGQSVTVPTNPAMQLVPVNWPSMWVGYTSNTNTWLRLRLASAADAMTVNNMTGYYPDGEVEDFSVAMGALLAKNILSFTANENNRKTVDLNWQLNAIPDLVQTVIERSKNSLQWDSLGVVAAGKGVVISYTSNDPAPYGGMSYYRLKLVYKNGAAQYSDVKSVNPGGEQDNSFHIGLNPANDYTTLKINSSAATLATVELTDNTGRLMLRKQYQVNSGENNIRIDALGRYSAGLYYISVKTPSFNAVERLIIKRN